MTSLSLDDRATRYGTDKASGWHGYMVDYERHLRHLADRTFVLMELGVGHPGTKGASLFTWRDHFPNADIVGVDIREDAREVEGERITVEIGDCSDAAFLSALVERYDPLVVIDDASHIWSHQMKSLRTVVPLLQSGSIFIMEDLHTSFGGFRDKPVFADQQTDTASLIIALSAGLLGSRAQHPCFNNIRLSVEDQAVLDRVKEIAFIRSAVIMRIEDRPLAPSEERFRSQSEID